MPQPLTSQIQLIKTEEKVYNEVGNMHREFEYVFSKIKVFLRPGNFQTSFLEFKTKNLFSKILTTKKRLNKNFNKDIFITKGHSGFWRPSFFAKSTIKIIIVEIKRTLNIWGSIL